MLILLVIVVIPLVGVSLLLFSKPFNINKAKNTIKIGYPIHFKEYDLSTYTFYVYVSNVAPLAIKKRFITAWKLVIFALPQNSTTVFINNIHLISGRSNSKFSAEKEKDKFISLLQTCDADFNVDVTANHITIKNSSHSKIYEEQSIAFFSSILK